MTSTIAVVEEFMVGRQDAPVISETARRLADLRAFVVMRREACLAAATDAGDAVPDENAQFAAGELADVLEKLDLIIAGGEPFNASQADVLNQVAAGQAAVEVRVEHAAIARAYNVLISAIERQRLDTVAQVVALIDAEMTDLLAHPKDRVESIPAPAPLEENKESQ